MIFGTVINPELQDEIVVTVIATGFEDKPSSQGRKATSTGFGSSVNSSSNHQSVASAKEDSFSAHTSHSQSSESVNERSHNTKDDDIPSFIRNREERRSRRTRR